MEDLQEALREGGLTVSALPAKGRSLFTAKDFYPGEVIIRQEPYVFVPNNSASERRCEGCFSSSNLKKCSACRVVWYCGCSCQKSQWKVHQLECRALARLDEDKRKAVTPTIRLMLKLYIRRKLQDEKFSCNAHTICDSELRPLGTGLYPVISIINHSCLPNAVLVFEGTAAVVRTVQRISGGSEVSISYIETARSTMTRLKALKEQYFFTCSCPRCDRVGQPADIQESAVLEGYRCKDDNCTGFLLRDSDDRGFRCQQCGLLREKEELKEITNEIRTMSEKAVAATSSAKLEEAISIYKMIEKLQGELYHPYSIFLLQPREKLLKMLMEVEDWKEALAYCRITIPIYERIYPTIHPLLGLQYYTCGKLEWLLGDSDVALKSLGKAVDILRVTHGTSTPFMKELMMRLEEARAEASYKIRPIDE
ncbi:histone-lysine N-methyltransferase ASHR1 isoform X2 [Punica granatum]|uniref:Histone-lysine N-methyltransferase ASHR1 isoform X2 n=1 Tax=Punica granatum TaxID=22663 RepID=A0A6P8D2B3_PUNGR|nr:histone-lysine N-methyltransferase ASHR1 isoform X2 [Punica granatum]